MSRDKKIGDMLDEVVSKLKGDVQVLKTQQATLITNNKNLEKRSNELSQEILDNEKKLSKVKEEYKDRVSSMLKNTQDKLNRANSLDAEAAGLKSELLKKTKEAEGLIKSNEGLRENLNKKEEVIKAKSSKLESIISSIKDTLKDL